MDISVRFQHHQRRLSQTARKWSTTRSDDFHNSKGCLLWGDGNLLFLTPLLDRNRLCFVVLSKVGSFVYCFWIKKGKNVWNETGKRPHVLLIILWLGSAWARILRLQEIIMQVFATPSTPFGCKALKKNDIAGAVWVVFATPLLPLCCPLKNSCLSFAYSRTIVWV